MDLRNRLGDFAAVSNLLAEAKIEILSSTFVRGMGGKPGTWQVFVQPLNPDTTVEETKRLLLSCPDVINCHVKESRDGLLVDSLTFPIKISSGQRAMIMRNDVWNSMLQKTREKFSSGRGRHHLRAGYMAGRTAGKELKMALGKDKVVEQMDQIIATYQALGWGKAKIISFRQSPSKSGDPNVGKRRVHGAEI